MVSNNEHDKFKNNFGYSPLLTRERTLEAPKLKKLSLTCFLLRNKDFVGEEVAGEKTGEFCPPWKETCQPTTAIWLRL